jgi:hypothetical protein
LAYLRGLYIRKANRNENKIQIDFIYMNRYQKRPSFLLYSFTSLRRTKRKKRKKRKILMSKTSVLLLKTSKKKKKQKKEKR